MNILWITNIILPEVAKELGMPASNMEGWLASMLCELTKIDGLELSISTTYDGNKLIRRTTSNITYILLPAGKPSIKYSKSAENLWRNIIKDHSFDLIHIHGTEYTHALALMNAYPNENYIISIQGMVSVISRYYYSGISTVELLKNITFRDIIRNDMMLTGTQKWMRRGKLEKEYFRKTKHVIGRTIWDMVHAKEINPQLTYHFCNETLRPSFYKYRWNLKRIKKHSIFLSQASYPIKGLHIMLKALSIIKRTYPDCIVNIAGQDIVETDTFKSKIKLSGYGKYIQRMIKKLDLNKNVKFLGHLNETKMAEMYAKSHVFVSPSSIENSSNSVGEAQLVGTPVVASFVGGIQDMAEHNKTALLYRFEEYEILAYFVIQIFQNDNQAELLSNNGRIAAGKRHNAKVNAESLLNIYKNIVE